MSTEKFKEKRKLTCLETYGVEYPNQSDKVKEKIKNTCLKKYGVTNYVLSTEYKSNIKDIVNKNKDFELDLKTKDNIFTAILNVEN